MAPNRARWITDMDPKDDEEDYEIRKIAMLARIRLKWPKREHLTSTSVEQQKQLKEWICPLVKLYNVGAKMESWSEEQRLVFYTSWAFAVNSWSREEKRGKNYQDAQAGNETETTDRSAPNGNTESHSTAMGTDADIHESIEGFDQQNAKHPQSIPLRPNSQILAPMSQAGSNFTTPKLYSAPSTGSSTNITIDWDAIEVCIDARVVGLGNVWLPMISLKPDATGSCHWKDFEVKKLRELLERDTEKKIDMAIHSIVYPEHLYVEGIIINAQGSYNIALKRFFELGETRGNTFHLSVQLKDKALIAGDGYRGKMQGTTLPVRQTRANKSRFDGGSSDFSNEG